MGGGIGTFGYLFQDDFMGAPNTFTTNAAGQWSQWGTWIDTSCTLGQQADTTNLPLEGGVIGMKGTGTSNKTVLLAGDGASGFGFLDASSSTGKFRGKMWFEASVMFSNVSAATNAFFIGLCDTTTAPTSAGSVILNSTIANGLATTDGLFGFYKPGTNAAGATGTLAADLAVAYNVAAGTVQFPGSASNLRNLCTNYGGGAIVPVTFTAGNITTPSTMRVKIGWVFDPTPANVPVFATAAVTANQTAGTLYRPTIKFFVNGNLAGAFLINTDIQASTFPSKWMVPVIAHAWGGSGAGVAYVDWIRIAQLGTN